MPIKPSRKGALEAGVTPRSPVRPPKRQLDQDADDLRALVAKRTSAEAVPNYKTDRQHKIVSTGFLSLDFALGVNGFAEGRIHAIEGETGAGKTAVIAAAGIAAFQRKYPTSVHSFVDAEGTADIDFFNLLGVDTSPERLIIFRPDSAEEALAISMLVMGYEINKNSYVLNPKLKPVCTNTYDSWAGSATDLVGMSPLARLGAEWWPRISGKARRVNTTVFAINQLREKPGVSFGDPRYGPGGKTFHFMQSTLLWATKTNVEKDEVTKMPVAHDLRLDIKKNKLAAPFHKIFLHLNYRTGFDRIVDAFTFLETRGVSMKVTADGNSYSFKYQAEGSQEEVTAKGRSAFLDALRGDPWAGEAFIETARQLAQEGIDGES